MSDQHCQSLGIPDRLHRENRPLIGFDDSKERMFRRFLLAEANLQACIKFGDMSVNREKLSPIEMSLPADVLINEKTGERYVGCGIAVFDVASLRSTETDGLWRIKDVPGEFELRPKHAPNVCNYAHAEIEVYKDGAKIKQIKPTLVKLAIRRHLQSCVSVIFPEQMVGKTLDLDTNEPNKGGAQSV